MQSKQPSIRFFYTYFLIHYYRDLLPELVNRGWSVEVVISSAEYQPGISSQFHPGVRVKYIPTLGFKPNGTLGKLMITLTYILFGVPYTLFGPPVDNNIFFTQPPLISAFWGYVLKKIRKQNNYQILQDIFPDIAIETGFLKRGSFLSRIFMNLSRFPLHQADYIGVIGRCMEQKLLQEGFHAGKITLLPNWANADLVKPIEHENNPFRIEQGWQDRFVMIFAGNVGIPQYFDDLLQVCRQLRDKHPKFLLAFIGNGSRINYIQEYKAQYDLDNIVLISFQNIERQSEFLSAGDIHFVSLKAGIEGLAVPSKSYSIMAAGRPIVYQGMPEGEMARLVTEHAIGTSIPLNNPTHLEQTILDYINNPTLRQTHGQNARQLSETICGYQSANNRIIELLYNYSE